MTGADTDREQFDDLMSVLDHPMLVVTTAAGGSNAGCLVGFHAQCGIEPPGYAVWLSKANHTYRVGALADTFAVHFLGPNNRPLAELFGTFTGNEIDKFERCAWHPGPDSVPLLDDCEDRFVGQRRAWLDPGSDHVCLVLEPTQTTRSGHDGWLTFEQVQDLDAAHPAEDRQRPRPGE